jgi:hypothetical protein
LTSAYQNDLKTLKNINLKKKNLNFFKNTFKHKNKQSVRSNWSSFAKKAIKKKKKKFRYENKKEIIASIYSET